MRARRGYPRLIGSVILIALSILATSPAVPATRPQQDAAEQTRLDLERLQSQIAALETRLAEMGERRGTLVDEFESADVELVLSRRRLELIQTRLLVLFQQSKEYEATVERLAGELDRARSELSARVVALYRMGPLSYSRFLLAADDPEEILSNYQLIGRLASQDRTLVSGISANLIEHEAAVRSMDETVERLSATRDEEVLAIRAISPQQELRQELIRQIDIEAAAGRQALADQEESAAALEALITEVSSVPVAPATESAPEALIFSATRGALPWPAEGPILTTFGRKKHEIYDTYTLHKGIEIDAGAGTDVSAVFQGRVVFADWFQNYGLVVIIGHGDDFFTIYGHLDAVRVRTNEWVEAAASIGTVGETGSVTGPNLYFEIREGSEAVNPTIWLQSR